MSIHSSLKQKLVRPESPAVQGQWQPIRFCADLAADEYLNVGVFFQDRDGDRHVRMLDHFDRLQCLYTPYIDEKDLIYLLEEVESVLVEEGVDSAPELEPHITLGAPLYASGESSEDILTMFYDSIVTLAKPKLRGPRPFHHVSPAKIRAHVFETLRQALPLKAESIIQDKPLELKIGGARKLPVDLPLVGARSIGAIASAYYKSPMVIANNVMQSVYDLALAKQYGDRKNASLSLLIPGTDAALNAKERRDVDREIGQQLSRARALDIEIIQGETVAEVAQATANWWKNAA